MPVNWRTEDDRSSRMKSRDRPKRKRIALIVPEVVVVNHSTTDLILCRRTDDLNEGEFEKKEERMGRALEGKTFLTAFSMVYHSLPHGVSLLLSKRAMQGM